MGFLNHAGMCITLLPLSCHAALETRDRAYKLTVMRQTSCLYLEFRRRHHPRAVEAGPAGGRRTNIRLTNPRKNAV